jgi:deazaflavin-dependent oxidoreductase (nitroreductase family)
MNTLTTHHYRRPGWFTQHLFNPSVAWLTRRGVSVWDSRVLEVRGRTSGEWRAVPVNLLDVDGVRHLVAPRGETDWVRNLRAAREGRLRIGRRTEAFRATELAVDDRPAILRAYLRRWKWEVGAFFAGVDADSTDAELAAIAHDHPVFAIEIVDPDVGQLRP